MFLITVSTVDGSVTIGFEGNLGFLSAICTSYIVHFTWCTIIPTTTIGSFFFFHYDILPLCYCWAPCFLGAAGLANTDEVFNLMDINRRGFIKSYL